MEPHSQSLVPVEFESQAFGFPYFRVAHFDRPQVAAELDALACTRPLAADCKTPADDVCATHGLLQFGFRKVCMQIVLRHDLTGGAESAGSGVQLGDRLDVQEEILGAHARNFTRDRFSLDPLLPAAGRHRLYSQWLRNSLGGARLVAHIGEANICTFSRQTDEVVIDLVSVLEPGRGHGSCLIGAVLEWARQDGAPSVRVTTECENTGAWTLYSRKGFVPVKYVAVFHLVLP